MKDTNVIEFQAEISQLMNIIINNFYSNKDVFLRELISNASDAIDKVRYLQLSDENYSNNKEYHIKISMDKEKKILSIEDTGIGMSKDELISNLGTIARSGTKKFYESLKDNNDNIDLIGQFGMGFYSAYLVSDKVVVTSKKEDSEPCSWESEAKSSFSVSELEDNEFNRGTKIDLYLKDNMDEYLKESNLKDIIIKHSQFINYPIELYIEKTKEEEIDEDPLPETEPVDAEAEPVDAEADKEPETVDTETVDAEAEPVDAEAEPVDAEAEPVDAEAEPEPVDADAEPESEENKNNSRIEDVDEENEIDENEEKPKKKKKKELK